VYCVLDAWACPAWQLRSRVHACMSFTCIHPPFSSPCVWNLFATPTVLIVAQRLYTLQGKPSLSNLHIQRANGDTRQMSLGLEALFEERLEVFAAEPTPVPSYFAGGTEAIVQSLIRERNGLQAQVKEDAVTIEQLRHRNYSKLAADAALPPETVRRLCQLEHDNERLRKENNKLSENLRAAERETATLRDSLEDKSQKVKGANKKTKIAKQVAVKEEEKAKTAVNEKDEQKKLRKQMKQEEDEARKAHQEQEKMVQDLLAELSIEQAGSVHLRETEGTQSDSTTVVIPMELIIRRQDYRPIQDILEANRVSYVNRAKEWYEAWKLGKGEENDTVVRVVGANYLDDEKEKDKLYGDMIEDGFMMTGGEHDS
jgi:hypothetical protein